MAVHAPPSDDGIYGLVDLSHDAPAETDGESEGTVETTGSASSPASAPVAAQAPAPPSSPSPAEAPTARKGLFGRFLRKDKAAEPAPGTEAASSQADPKAQTSSPPSPPPKPAEPAGPKLRTRKKKARTLRYTAPAWVVSAVIHGGLLGFLGVVAITAEAVHKPPQIDSAPFDPKLSAGQAEELVHIYAPPSAQARDQAVGDASASSSAPGAGLGVGTGPPSATPRVGMSTAVGEGHSLPQVKVVGNLSGLAMLPNMPSKDFGLGGSSGGGGGGGISGDVTMGTKDVGEALDQLAREILRHLQAHKLTVVWLFDESGSMKDDQKAIKDKFSRVSSELKLNVDADKKSAGALNHAVIGFGENYDDDQGKPTPDVDRVGKAIDRLRVDSSGTENTCQAITRVVNDYAKLIGKDRRLLIVLVTDESGDDGDYVEEARTALVSRGVPLYVIGRQALFGYDRAHLLYIDPVTKEHYWPTIKRGPESAARETLQVDGLHDRWDEQPSGFAPYELARLAKDSGGIYFLLPSEENMRVRQREKAYSMTILKEYVPDYESRAAYFAARDKSELRKAIAEVIDLTSKDFVPRRHYPVNPPECLQAILDEFPKCRARLTAWVEVEKRLRKLQPLRDREPDKRWQAHFDLMLAQVVTYQVKIYEYMACLDEMVALLKKDALKPSKMPEPGKLDITWVINHSTDRKAPKAETDKKYAEAKHLLELVIQRHKNTPWADLAQDEFARGFGCQRNEEHHGPGYAERAKYVPKY